MFRKLYNMDQEKVKGVVAIHLNKSVAQPCDALAHILSVSLSVSSVIYDFIIFFLTFLQKTILKSTGLELHWRAKPSWSFSHNWIHF